MCFIGGPDSSSSSDSDDAPRRRPKPSASRRATTQRAACQRTCQPTVPQLTTHQQAAYNQSAYRLAGYQAAACQSAAARPQPGQTDHPATPPGGQVPAPVRNAAGKRMRYEQCEMTRAILVSALTLVSQFLNHYGQKLTLIAVGGAVSAIFLQSRPTTHDVDFFSRPLGEPQLSVLRAASQHAIDNSFYVLSPDWLNNETARAPGVAANLERLVLEARQQKAVVFEKPGLRVLAAPWHFAFVQKVNRIARGTRRAYDRYDAIVYLFNHTSTHTAGRPVSLATVQGWASQYKAACPVPTLREVNTSYRQAYKVNGIALYDDDAW